MVTRRFLYMALASLVLVAAAAAADTEAVRQVTPVPPGPDSLRVTLMPTTTTPSAAAPTGRQASSRVLDASNPPVAKIHHYSTDVGYAYGVEPVYPMLPTDSPWIITVTTAPLQLEGGTPQQTIPPVRVQVHDLKSDPDGTGWVDCSGQSGVMDYIGDRDGWLYLEFRILVQYVDRPGHYVGSARLEFTVYPPGWDEPYTGQIPLELHLNVPELFSVQLDPELSFPDTQGNYEGWMYTEKEGRLTVSGNLDFNLQISAGDDLTGPGTRTGQIETALRLRQPWGTGALWSTWGDLGGDLSGHGKPTDWIGAVDPSAPWPGTVQSPGYVTSQGINEIGLSGAAWRSGVQDLAGDYSGALTITVSPMP